MMLICFVYIAQFLTSSGNFQWHLCKIIMFVEISFVYHTVGNI